MSTFAFRTLCLVSSMAAMPACAVSRVEPNDNHCANQDGDAYCGRLFPDRPYCAKGFDECAVGGWFGCVAEVSDECRDPCGMLGGDGCDAMNESSSGTTGSTTETETGSTGGPTSTTGPGPCVDDEDCPDAAAPFCEPKSGECVRCDGSSDGDAACAGLDPGAPLCVEGACVACTPENPLVCDEQLLLCDGETNACVACTEHAQCEAGACDVFDGRCFDPNNVLHVGMEQPYGSIIAALDDAGAMMLDPVVLVLHEGVDFNETATVSAGVVAFVAAEGEQPQWVNTSVMAPTLTVTGLGTRVYLHDVRLTGNLNDLGLVLDDGAWVDVRRSRIVQNAGGGIRAQNGAELALRNSFVGGDVNDANAMEVNGAAAVVVYSTLGAGTFNAAALACTSPIGVEIRNSILVSRGGTPPDEVSCPDASISFSAAEGMIMGEQNAMVGMFPGGTPEDWFVNFSGGDFGLQNDGILLFADVAQWQLGDPTTDIDGDLRPTMDGTPDYAGADIPPP